MLESDANNFQARIICERLNRREKGKERKICADKMAFHEDQHAAAKARKVIRVIYERPLTMSVAKMRASTFFYFKASKL